MTKDALIKTNPYLKDASQRDKMILMTANSSTAIEGVHVAIPLSSLRREIRKDSAKTSSKHA